MTIIYALFIVLNEVDYLDDILAAFVEVGVSGATILDSQGMASLIVSSEKQNIPIFGTFKSIIEDSRPFNKTIFSVLESDKLVEKTVNVIKEVMEDVVSPGTGFMFTVPIGKTYTFGLQK